jgi:tocopherol O-methyltransferase
VTGYTVSKLQHAFAVAAIHSGPPCRYILADWLNTQADDGPFETVLAIESTEHMRDKEGFFLKAFRVLNPGGRLVVCAWIASEKARSWEIERLLEPICVEGQLTSLGTETEYLSWIREAGFKRVRSTDLSREVSKTWRIIAYRVVRELLRKRAWQYLANPEHQNRSFLKCVFRIAVAYRTGAFRYLVFSAQRSCHSGGGTR